MSNSNDPTPPPSPARRPSKEDDTQIDGHALSPSTMMMGYGFDPMLSEGALKAPIFLTSTFAFESAAAGKRHFEGITGKRPGGADGLVYGRFNGPNQEILEKRLAIWDQAEEALVFSSGMSAISTLLLAHVSQHDVILHSGPLYAATETVIANLLSRFGATYVDFPADASRADMDAALAKAKAQAAAQGGKVAMVYLESPANPTNALVDVAAMRAAVDAAFPADMRPPIAMDNSFLGPVWSNPLAHGADIIVYSLTKYIGGHSDLVAGGVLGAKQWLTPIRMTRNIIGTICDPHTAWMLLRSLETVELRMTRAGENAQKVCTYLRDHPKIEGLGYLGFLADGPQKQIFDQQYSGAGSTFSLFIKGGEAECYRFLDALKIAKLAVSLGGTETLASHPASMTHLSVPDARKAALGITDNLVRLSIGIENADDLIADFRQALAAV